MDTRPIGIFDSGVGGLTVLKELQKEFINEDFIYLGDTLNFPYGEKTKKEITKFSKNNIKYLIKQNVKLIIIACGTATSQCIDEVKKSFNIPIIGIIDPTVEYVKKSKIKEIGVMATNGTIRSGAWEINLKRKIPDIKVISKACPLLANIVEEGKIASKESLDAIHNYVQIFKENNINHIILGCTHYSLYDKIIKKEFNYDVNLISTAKGVTTYLKEFLKELQIENSKRTFASKIVITKQEKDFEKKAKNILEVNKCEIFIQNY